MGTMPDKNGWLPIAACPVSRDGEYPKYVLVATEHHVGTGYCQPDYEKSGLDFIDECGEPIEPRPTHWMPLPPKPEPTP